MLEIIRGRTWKVPHTILEGAEGPPTDLATFTSFKSQIREKTAVRNAQGIFVNKLVTDVVVVVDIPNSVLTLTLTREVTSTLQVGDYIIDLLGIVPVNSDETLLNPEPIRVTNHPTHPTQS